jgi:hypothetical protein
MSYKPAAPSAAVKRRAQRSIEFRRWQYAEWVMVVDQNPGREVVIDDMLARYLSGKHGTGVFIIGCSDADDET